ncbi:MAG: hypothetical protein GX754_01440 [Clostridiaceae bacterium]|nr:hypothetical protein [Clostridiaceae bacterium]
MNQKLILNVLGQVDDKFIEEATPAELVKKTPVVLHSFRFISKLKTALIAALIMLFTFITVTAAMHIYNIFIINRDTELPSYEVTAELKKQKISADALKDLRIKPYQAYKANYAEVEDYLGVDLLISERLENALLGEGVDIQGSYAAGEKPITSITLSSRHSPGEMMSGYINMMVYMSIGTSKTYEQITQILKPELPGKEAALFAYVSETNGIAAKFAVYESIGRASAYFVDNGIFYSITIGGFVKEDNVDVTRCLKELIDTFQRPP